MKTCLVLSLLLSTIAMAQSPGTFTVVGNMTSPRYRHSATLLPNGKVLIAGGFTQPGGNNTVASAELYDPANGTFAPTGSMTTPRSEHTATLLPNGKVLIAGGTRSSPTHANAVATAELYDPSTGTFTDTGSMTADRIGHAATLLPDGRVLIAGGHRDNNVPFPNPTDAELYDPSTGTFTSIGDLPVDIPEAPSTTLLADGRVLIAGLGAELYDPVTGKQSPIFVNIDTFRHVPEPKATMLMNGKVLFAGGNDTDPGDYEGAELYDPSIGIFTGTGSLSVARGDVTPTLLPDGTVLIAGSYGAGGTLASAELYDPVTGRFSNTGKMSTDRYGHTATLLNDGRVLIAGGGQLVGTFQSGVWVELSSAEIYHPGVLVPAPVLLSLSGDGKGQGAILHADTHQVVSPSNPAVTEEALEIYITGLIDSSVIPPQVAIGGRMAEVLFFGKAPGFVGLNQVNVRVPSGVAPGTAISVRMTYLSRPSNEVTIGVQ